MHRSCLWQEPSESEAVEWLAASMMPLTDIYIHTSSTARYLSDASRGWVSHSLPGIVQGSLDSFRKSNSLGLSPQHSDKHVEDL